MFSMFSKRDSKQGLIDSSINSYREFIRKHAILTSSSNSVIYNGNIYGYNTYTNRFSLNTNLSSISNSIHTPLIPYNTYNYHSNVYGYEVKETHLKLDHQCKEVLMVECVEHIGGKIEITTSRDEHFYHPLIDKISDNQFKSKLIKHKNGSLEYDGAVYNGYTYSKKFIETNDKVVSIDDKFIEFTSSINFFRFSEKLSYQEVHMIIKKVENSL